MNENTYTCSLMNTNKSQSLLQFKTAFYFNFGFAGRSYNNRK